MFESIFSSPETSAQPEPEPKPKQQKHTPPKGSIKYNDYYFVDVRPSAKEQFKYDAVYWKNGKDKTVSFGKKEEQDYIDHKDKKKKEYNDWLHRDTPLSDPMSPKYLAKHILNSKTTLEAGLREYRKLLKTISEQTYSKAEM